MSIRISKMAVLLMALSFTLVSPTLRAQLSAEERLSISNEITVALEKYHRVFSTGTPGEIASQIYGTPLVSISTDGATTIWNTVEEVENWVAGFLSNIKEQGWYRSQMPSPSICVLGPNTGFASGQFIRYRQDGSEISRSGMAYVFQRKPEGWRMTTFLAHENDVELAC